ncbi:hypothetical protein [Nonomuraea sp. NPDC050540]|uniref:hypothetical protein n=1 Tax=Nonomuraea sp. NPDC050540 TaxID=3364367 RepID=UPI003793C1AE
MNASTRQNQLAKTLKDDPFRQKLIIALAIAWDKPSMGRKLSESSAKIPLIQVFRNGGIIRGATRFSPGHFAQEALASASDHLR